MPPDDPTPLGDAMTHRFANQKIPDPKPNADDAGRDNPTTGAARAGDISERPPLPGHPERTAADIEDEEADPVIDTGPGITDGVLEQKKKRG